MTKKIIKENRKALMEKFFDTALFAELWKPNIDVYETEKNIIMLVELAGVNPKDIEVGIDQENHLHIWGKRYSPIKAKSKNCKEMGLHFGTFSRYIKLNCKIDTKSVQIKNINGLFKITIKKKK